MKRVYSIILCLVLATALAVTATAAGAFGASAAAGKTHAFRGEEIEVIVSVSGATGLSGGLQVQYNEASLELVSGTFLMTGMTLSDFSVGEKNGVFLLGSSQTISGQVAKCVFKVKADAPFAATDIKFSVKFGSQTEQASTTVTVVCNHSFGGWTADASGTTHSHSCTICGAPESVAHTWNGGEVTTASTCAAEGVKTFTCTAEGCGAQKTEPIAKTKHKYDNSCDTTCNACGAERKTSHKYPDKYTSDETGHWYQCTVCKHKKDVAAHKPGAEPTEQTAQTCTVCGFIIKPALGHTHDYQLEWSADGTHHWHACNGCDNQHELAEHVYDNSCDKDCNVCGQERETEHIYYENYLSGENGHWHECRICGYQMETEQHTPNANGTCSRCGYKTQAADHTHSYGEAWNWDVTGHWQNCECGHNSEAEPHRWDDGRIAKKPTDTEDGARTYKCTVCGAEKSEIIPMGTVITDSFPWVVLLIVGGVAVVGVVIFLIVGVVKGKKKTGKFGEHAEQQEVTEE